MPEGPDGKTIIIVKKVDGHGGHHGGAWKVAYADFVTAMMALFMVLWLVNSASEPTRQRIASYFRKPGIFQKGSGTPMEMGGGGILPDVFAPPSDGNSTIKASEAIYKINAVTGRVKELYDEGEGSKEFRYAPKIVGDDGRGLSEEDIFKSNNIDESAIIEEKTKLEQLKTDIEAAIKASQEDGESLADGVLGDIEIKIDQRGLVIEIMDTDKVSMFSKGQANILPLAEDKLSEIAKILKTVPNPVDIEGHTDSTPFKGKGKDKYDNWNLASDRANAARRILQGAGFEKGRIARVVGYADERPRDYENPANPANRRITISMRYSDRAKAALDGTQTYETDSAKPKKKANPVPQVQKVESTKPSSKNAQATNGEGVKKGSSFTAGTAPSAKGATPASKSEPSKLLEKEGSGLKVEVSTRLPEGAVESSVRGQVEGSNKKSLIFKNPEAFFNK